MPVLVGMSGLLNYLINSVVSFRKQRSLGISVVRSEIPTQRGPDSQGTQYRALWETMASGHWLKFKGL